MLDFMESEFENPTEKELVNAIVIDTNPDLSKRNKKNGKNKSNNNEHPLGQFSRKS